MSLLQLTALICLFALTRGQLEDSMADPSSPETINSNTGNGSEYPDPRIVIVGPTGSGKSSLSNALLGCDPELGACSFPVCTSLSSCTKNTTIGTGQWLGHGENFTVIDTPGFGNSDGQDNNLIEEMIKVLNDDLGYTNIILLLLDGTMPRFTSGLHNMLRQMSSLFGEAWWDNMVIGVSKWEYSQAAIDKRQRSCDYFGNSSEHCKNEEWLMREITAHLNDKFHLDRNFTFAFIHSHSQTGPELADPVQQEHYQAQAQILWKAATAGDSKFVFRTIDDVLEENEILKKKNRKLNFLFETNIATLYSLVHENEERINETKGRVDNNEETTNANITTLLSYFHENERRINLNEENDVKLNANLSTLSSHVHENTIRMKGELKNAFDRIEGTEAKILSNEKGINSNTMNTNGMKGELKKALDGIDRTEAKILSNEKAIKANEQGIKDNLEKANTMKGELEKTVGKIVVNERKIRSNEQSITINNSKMEKVEGELSSVVNNLKLVPIGTILAWVSRPTAEGATVDIPAGWHRCDGSFIPHPSIWSGQRTPDLNNAKRFLRGGPDRNMLTMEEDQLQDHAHTVSDPGHVHRYSDRYGDPDINSNYGWKYGSGDYKHPDYRNTDKTYTGITVGEVASTYRRGTETRPKNMNVIYIMRVW